MRLAMLVLIPSLLLPDPTIAQPEGRRTPAIVERAPGRPLLDGLRLSEAQLERIRTKKLLEQAFDRARANQPRGQFETRQMQLIRQRLADPRFHGTLVTVDVGGQSLSIEKRRVRTRLGVKTLVLSRYGSTYVYDGDLVVPNGAVLDTESATAEEELRRRYPGIQFSAGYPGVFGNGALWDDGIIPFEADDNFCCHEELDTVARDLARRSNFRLVPRDGQPDYVRFMNAEILTTSRTELGKQQGTNEVRIQGFDAEGNPHGARAREGSIRHELGHEFGLIHEHLRSDRDQFIARNPNCSADDLWEWVRDVWIDTGNVAFTEDGAELLTPYDTDSIMHYHFRRLLADGTVCNTWVELATCTNGDPTAADCDGGFGGDNYTNLDLEGMHKLYIAVPGSGNFLNEPDQVRTFSDENIRHRGKRIDRCLHGLPFGSDGCNAASRDRVGDEFCETQGFRNGFNILYEDMLGVHSGYHDVLGWHDVWGGQVLTSITCENLQPASEQVLNGTSVDDEFVYRDIRINDRPVDRCVHGAGVQGDRCSEANQRRVADRFCREWGFEESMMFVTAFDVQVNATGYHPATDDFRNVSAADVFTLVKCLRPAAVNTSRRFDMGEIRVNSRQVDRCVWGDGITGDRCSQTNQRRVANEFCQTRGFDEAASFLVTLAPQLEASGYHVADDEFRNVIPAFDVFSSINCVND